MLLLVCALAAANDDCPGFDQQADHDAENNLGSPLLVGQCCEACTANPDCGGYVETVAHCYLKPIPLRPTPSTRGDTSV